MTKSRKSNAGRKPAGEEARNAKIEIRISDAERAKLQAIADAKGEALSKWARELLLAQIDN